jgi:SAM-dependent methyltransferase
MSQLNLSMAPTLRDQQLTKMATFLAESSQISNEMQCQILEQQQKTEQLLRQIYLNLNTRVTALERELHLHRCAQEPWYTSFLQAQSLVSEHCENNYYPVYKQYELGYWLPVPRWLAQDLTQGSPNSPLDVLDLGVAYGTLLIYSSLLNPACQLHGLDFNCETAARMGRIRPMTLQTANIELEEVSFGKQFDHIIFTEILEHFNFAPLPTLKKIKALLKPTGKLYLSTPDAAEWGRLPDYESWRDIPAAPEAGFAKTEDRHIYQYTQQELFELVVEAGFRVETWDFSPGYGQRHIAMRLVHA